VSSQVLKQVNGSDYVTTSEAYARLETTGHHAFDAAKVDLQYYFQHYIQIDTMEIAL